MYNPNLVKLQEIIVSKELTVTTAYCGYRGQVDTPIRQIGINTFYHASSIKISTSPNSTSHVGTYMSALMLSLMNPAVIISLYYINLIIL